MMEMDLLSIASSDRSPNQRRQGEEEEEKEEEEEEEEDSNSNNDATDNRWQPIRSQTADRVASTHRHKST